jgi:hypothetical protein
MRRLLVCPLIVVAFCAVTPAADPTPQDALALLTKMKARTQPPVKTAEPDKIVTIDFGRKPITNSDLKVIGVLKSVRVLNMGGPYANAKDAKGKNNTFAPKQINDDGLKSIAGMTELVTLELDGTHVTDAGLKHLAGMKKLKTLVLSSTRVTDEGMEDLTKLPSLETVTLFETKITDAGVTTLKRWKLSLVINR